MKKNILIVLVTLLIVLGVNSSQTLATDDDDGCGEIVTYEKTSDFDNSRVHIDFHDSDHQIDVTAISGYKIIKVELRVEEDGHDGFYEYANGPMNNFDPNPGDDIDEARVEVEKVCASPSPSASPEPETSPSPSPETSPSPKVEYGLTAGSPDCGNNFHAEFKVKVGGVGQKDITVKLSYKAEEKTAITNSDGIAGVDFEFKGNGDLTAKSEGYENQTIGVQAKENCAVGGTTTSGQVLGASTLAETGVFDESLMALLFTLGSGLIGLGVKTYAKKN